MHKVIILRGISGSGKSTIAKALINEFKNTEEGSVSYHSADKTFIDDKGKYVFDPKRLPEAHQRCLRSFLHAIQTNIELVIVDNTNTQLWEMSPYISIAQAYQYEIEVIRCVCRPEVAAKRNVHNVPASTIELMLRRFENLLPFWPKEKTINTEE